MDSTDHDIRNHLAVAIGSIHAFLDGKLTPGEQNLRGVLTSLEAIEGVVSQLRRAASTGAPIRDEYLLDAVIEGSPYAKILVNDRGEMVLVNAQTETLFGYSRDELLGRTIDMLVPERFRTEHAELRDSFAAAPAARPMGAGRDLYGRRRDGSDVPIEIGLNPIRTETQRLTLAAISDITERKHDEALRLLHAGVQLHADQLEELNRELTSASRFKTQFVATMSHELRTPLTAIIGAAELLAKGNLDARARISVETISEAAETLFALINSVLDFSKIEAGKVELHTATFGVDAVLEGTADFVAQLAREKGLTLYTYVDPGIPALAGDADRLRQIVLNLLGNAVKFTERGRIVARAFAVERSNRDVLLRVEVEDTGVGIAPDVLPLLFEPFSQAASSAQQVTGTGLGLSISRSLVELMGGTIGVKSELDAGSCFWFTARFPLAAEPLEAHRKMLDDVAGLIVSGDDTFAQIVERYMTSWSIQSRRVHHRESVVEAMQDNVRTWIAIVDLDTLGQNGSGVTIDILRTILPARVIAIGKDSPLRKPVRQSHLYDAIVKASGPQRAPAALAPRPAAPALRPSGTILVAEDNAQLQRLLQLQFDDLGVPVVFVSDGRQVVEALRRDAYAMIFMDCQMPAMDGLAATRAIRAQERESGGHIAIAAMTANAFSEDREACIDAGMDDYLAKPIRLADLRAMVERWSGQLSAEPS